MKQSLAETAWTCLVGREGLDWVEFRCDPQYWLNYARRERN